jgi:beta,beta-carotene 9',10'-dioxygenase
METMMQTVSRPGYAHGLETLDSEIELDSLPVEGAFPEWLTGTLLRNGPAKFEVGERTVNHWFDGLAMLHKFSFAGGRVSYANRFLQSGAQRAAEERRISYSEFATDPCRSIFKRAATLFRPRPSDNCNVNLTRLGDEYIAMTETPLPIAFDPETLETLGVAFRPPGIHATAHPHHDPARGELIAYVTHFGPRSEYRVFAQRDRATQRRIAAMRVSEPSYMHSFALTERYAVLVAFPLVVNPLRLASGARPFIENYRWKPEQGTRVLVFDRENGELRGRYEAEPCFSFHHVNAFERNGELIVDMAAYEDATIVDSLYLERLRAEPPPPSALARLWRYRIDLDRSKVDEEQLSDAPLELPRIDYRERNGRPYRYVYGVGAPAPARRTSSSTACSRSTPPPARHWSGRSPGPTPASRSSSRRRSPIGPRTRACCSRSCSTPLRRRPTSSSSTRPAWGSWAELAYRTTSPSGFTGSTSAELASQLPPERRSRRLRIASPGRQRLTRPATRVTRKI